MPDTRFLDGGDGGDGVDGHGSGIGARGSQLPLHFSQHRVALLYDPSWTV
jgi:hypothetical protein